MPCASAMHVWGVVWGVYAPRKCEKHAYIPPKSDDMCWRLDSSELTSAVSFSASICSVDEGAGNIKTSSSKISRNRLLKSVGASRTERRRTRVLHRAATLPLSAAMLTETVAPYCVHNTRAQLLSAHTALCVCIVHAKASWTQESSRYEQDISLCVLRL
eukprot:5297475-Prymnesium_polylepis.1